MIAVKIAAERRGEALLELARIDAVNSVRGGIHFLTPEERFEQIDVLIAVTTLEIL